MKNHQNLFQYIAQKCTIDFRQLQRSKVELKKRKSKIFIFLHTNLIKFTVELTTANLIGMPIYWWNHYKAL